MKREVVQASFVITLIVSCVLAQVPTRSTVAPTTPSTTAAPTTLSTTSAPTTAVPTTPSTTAAPTTAAPTSAAPTTSTTPAPTEGSWNWPVDRTPICIKLNLNAEFLITYNTTSGKPKTATIDLPIRGVGVTGDCNGYNSSEAQWIALSWQDANSTDFSLGLNFSSTATAYKVDNITLDYLLSNASFPDVVNPDVPVRAHLLQSVDFLTAQLKDSLQCTVDKDVQLNDANVHGVSFKIENIQLQAYMNTTDNTFGTAENCVPPHNSDIVPIAVGCALALLVIIVLVAYLIGRRRSRQQGYQSV